MITSDGSDSRPSLTAAALSPTALANFIACLAMLSCLPLTLSAGDGPSRDWNHSAVAILVSATQQFSLALLYLWPFLFAFCTLLLTAVLVIIRPSWYDRALLALPILFALFLTTGWVLVLFSDTEDSRAAMMVAALVTPPASVIALRMMWLGCRGELAAAAVWGQGLLCVLAIFSLRWLWLLPIDRMLAGGWLAMISAGLMMVASWTWGKRAGYDLHDRSSRCLPLQITLRQIVIGMTLTAVALTYWITFAGARLPW
jgi:hypothetical protein